METPRPIPKPRKFKPELLPQDHPLLGNKETVLEYTTSVSRRGERLNGSLLSDHRRRVVMQYIQESMDYIGSDPIADSTDDTVKEDVRMEDDSVPEESDITYHQEVMTGYENNPIVPTSHGVEPLTRRCSQGAEVNEAISFVPKQIASTSEKARSSIIH